MNRRALCIVCLFLLLRQAVRGEQSVTLAPRTFASISPAAPFQGFFAETRKVAAATTPAWKSSDDDLAAWGPALVFPLLDPSVSPDTAIALAAPLESEGTAPLLMFRTLGLYAAKSRVPFAYTPTLERAVSRNLHAIEQATEDLEELSGSPGLNGWGSIGAGAWLAYLELLYPQYWDLGDPGAVRWGRDGVRIVDQLLVRGALPGGGFRSDPRDEQVSLWPTALGIMALVQAYEVTQDVKYEAAAFKAAAAVETLRAEDGGYYRDAAHAQKDARANAYLANALLLLFKDSGEAPYRARVLGIVRWLTHDAARAAAAGAGDAALGAHVAYVVLLADSLATMPFENLLGRRPMRVTSDSEGTASRAASVAGRLRPPEFRYREMFDAVLRTLVERVPVTDGDIAYDAGDAPGYATEVLLRGGDTSSATPIVQREAHLARWPRPRNLEEVSFGAAALLEATQHPDGIDAATAASSLRRYLLLSGGLAFVDRYYLSWVDWLANGFVRDYGPTVFGAQVASADLRYAQQFPDGSIAGMMSPAHVGRALLDGADRMAWDQNRHVYRARPSSAEIALLPNAMIMIDLLDAARVTGETSYSARAEDVVHGLDVLWDEQRGAYFADTARTGDQAYEALSGNSYAALALLRLSTATQRRTYRDRALRIFDFINRDLYADGIIYHHLDRGRRASGDIWCTGCNWRVVRDLAEMAAQP